MKSLKFVNSSVKSPACCHGPGPGSGLGVFESDSADQGTGQSRTQAGPSRSDLHTASSWNPELRSGRSLNNGPVLVSKSCQSREVLDEVDQELTNIWTTSAPLV